MNYLSKIERVYVINLPSRDDRRRQWVQQRAGLQVLQNRIQIYPAVDGRQVVNTTGLKAGELGCSMSHIAVWKDAQEKGYNFILVLEDDVLFGGDFEKKLNNLLEAVQENFDWVYLYNTWDYRPVEKYSAVLDKVIASLGTQAYLLNVKSVNRILPFVEEFVFPIDVVMGHMSFLSKVYRPKEIFVQHDEQSASDIASASQVKKSVNARLKSYWRKLKQK